MQLHENLSNEEYHKLQGLSASGLGVLLNNPYKYWYQYLSGQYKKEQSKNMLIGTGVHMFVLEPNLFHHHFTQLPEDIKIRRGKVYEKFVESNLDKHILNNNEMLQIIRMAKSINNYPLFKQIKDSGKVEHSFVWYDESGTIMRSRPDFYNTDFVIDLKTTTSIHTDDFAKSISTYGYHRQAAMQLYAVNEYTQHEHTHLFLCVEEQEPYLAAMFALDDESLLLGREEYKKGAAIYHQCITNNSWPTLSESVQSISLPHWYLKRSKHE